jgi:hypothetical protein
MVTALAGLKHLELYDNRVSQLPMSLTLATSLTRLVFHGGDGLMLTPTDVDLVFCQLTQLRKIDLTKQAVTPDFKAYLASRMPQLQFK